jgi:nitroreductase
VKKVDVLEAIKERRSVREYTDKTVSEDDIKKLINAAQSAPTAGNTQPLELVIVKDAEIKRKLTEAAFNQSFVQKAPVVIVVCADVSRSHKGYGERGKNLYSIQDTAASTQNILLTAHALGLATCWVGAFHDKNTAKAINAPKNVKPFAIIPVGYPAVMPLASKKMSVNEIVHYETF